jgi:pyruvate carboxylase
MGLANRWPEIARTYAEVNQLFGDIVKVTPSSKVVGDMAMFLVHRGIKPADVVNLEPGLLKREATDDDVYSHLMYPQVFADFVKHDREFSDVSVLPTPAFFYGLFHREEITFEIEEGKTLIVRRVNVSDPDKDGRRTVTFELNGMTRDASIVDRNVAPQAKARPRADLSNPLQAAAPIPGLVSAISVTVGTKVSKGDKLLMMEAMKMQTTVYAAAKGVVDTIHVQIGDTVESKDLLVQLKAV